MRSNNCSKCQGTMVEGFVVTEHQGISVLSSWAEGPPKRGWFGLKRVGKRIDIATWRCQRCGLLESYATG